MDVSEEERFAVRHGNGRHNMRAVRRGRVHRGRLASPHLIAATSAEGAGRGIAAYGRHGMGVAYRK